MTKLYMCAICGQKMTNITTKQCPCCTSDRVLEVKSYAESTIRKEMTVPGFNKKASVIMSVEALQDMKVIELELANYRASEPTEEEIAFWQKLEDRHFFGKIRTPAPTEEEVADWQQWDKFFGKLDLDRVRRHYNVKILHDEEPYSDISVDHSDCEYAKTYNKGEPFDWMRKAWNFDTFWDLWKEWDENGRHGYAPSNWSSYW